jgi:hypothetical protein
MRDDIWIEDDDEPRRKPRSVLGIVAIAAVPWLIVAGVVLFPDRDRPPSPESGAAGHGSLEHPTDGEVAEGDVGVTEGNGDDEPSPTLSDPTSEAGAVTEEATPDGASAEARSASRDGDAPGAPLAPADASAGYALDRRLAATATVVARAWATGVDPHLDVPGVTPVAGARYAEHVAVESIERPGSEFAVVTLIAVVLEDLEDGLGAELRRIAVPLAIEDEVPRLAGIPWWLTPPGIETAEPTRQLVPSAEVDAEAEAALLAAGYREVEVAAGYRTAGWPWVVEVVGLAPGGETIAGELWLRLQGDRFVLAGEPARVSAEGGP